MFKYLRLRTRVQSPVNFKIKFNAINRFPKSIGSPKKRGFKFRKKTVKIKKHKKGKFFKKANTISSISVNRVHGNSPKHKKTYIKSKNKLF